MVYAITLDTFEYLKGDNQWQLDLCKAFKSSKIMKASPLEESLGLCWCRHSTVSIWNCFLEEFYSPHLPKFTCQNPSVLKPANVDLIWILLNVKRLYFQTLAWQVVESGPSLGGWRLAAGWAFSSPLWLKWICCHQQHAYFCTSLLSCLVPEIGKIVQSWI